MGVLQDNPQRFYWEDRSYLKFQLALLSEDVQNMIVGFNFKGFEVGKEGINDAVEDFVRILHRVAVGSLRVKGVGKRKGDGGGVQVNTKSWFDEACFSARREVNAWGKLLSKNPRDKRIRSRYFLLKKKYFKLLKFKKFECQNHLYDVLERLGGGDPKVLWRKLNSLLKRSSRSDVKGGISVKSWIDHYKSLNQKRCLNPFAHIIVKVREYESLLVGNDVTDRSFTIGEVKRHIKLLKNGKCSGVDGILNEMLKCGCDVLVASITKLFNMVLESGIFPTMWSQALIISLYKKGDRMDPNNYRGISLLSCLGKLFTKVLNSRLLEQIKPMMLKVQTGFQKKYRTADNIFIFKCIVDKYLKRDNRKLLVCFVDFCKAFDSVWRDGLLYKLIQLGVGKMMYLLLKNMYLNSEFALVLEGGITEFFPSMRGVQQGDSLSPTLFNCFLNDLEFEVEGCHPVSVMGSRISHLLYADDLILLSESVEGLQNALDHLFVYCDQWDLSVNLAKTRVMRLSGGNVGKSRKQKVNFYYNEQILVECNEYEYLGMIINCRGSFVSGVKSLYNKGLKSLFNLLKCLSIQNTPVKLLCNMFDSLVSPVILYLGEIWYMEYVERDRKARDRRLRKGLSDVSDLNGVTDKCLIEGIHLKFCKMILGVHKYASNIAVRLELGRYPVVENIKTASLKYLFHILQLSKENYIIAEAFNLARELDEQGIFSWVSYIKVIGVEIGEADVLNQYIYGFHFDLDAQNVIVKHLIEGGRLKLKQKCEVVHFQGIFNDDRRVPGQKNKLRWYRQFKVEFGLEKYLVCIKSFRQRSVFTKFRISAHKLNIEQGRYKRQQIQERECSFCAGWVEDEVHFLFHCSKYVESRGNFCVLMERLLPGFCSLCQEDKQFLMMGSESEQIIHLVSKYILEMFETRYLYA